MVYKITRLKPKEIREKGKSEGSEEGRRSKQFEGLESTDHKKG